MDSRRKGKVVLTPRDVTLFGLLFRYKVANFKQLKAYIFPECDRNAAYRRVKKLVDSGHLKKIGRYEKCELTTGYCLTEKALNVHLFLVGEKLVRQEIASGSINHDLPLVDLGEKLKCGSGVNEFCMENELQSYESLHEAPSCQSFVKIRSDAMMLVQVGKRIFRIAIEYECESKTKSRWEEKILNYYLEGDIDAVFYVCANGGIRRGLVEIDKKVSTDFVPKIYFSDSAQFKSGCDEVIFLNSRGKSFNLRFHK